MQLYCVIPVHNEGAFLAAEISEASRLIESLARGSELLLVENGSRDDSWEVAKRLAPRSGGLAVHAYQEPKAGLGYAYHRGVAEAIALSGASPAAWILLTAADFPFGMTDLEGFLQWRQTAPSGACAIGSKAHERSRLDKTWTRTVMSAGYRLLRYALLGMKTGDCQGTIFIRADVAQAVCSRIQARDFFYTTELVCYVERAGITVEELPIVLRPQTRPSTVRIFRDTWRMLRQLVMLRLHLPASKRSERFLGQSRAL